MARLSMLMLVPPAIFAGLAAMFYFGMQRSNPDEIPSTLIGREVPDLTLSRLGPEPPFTRADLHDGKVKIVNFWASWCAPCRAEHPNLLKLQEQGLPIYGINYKDRPEDALAFLAELGNPFTALGGDEQAKTGFEWGVTAPPESFVLDGEGKVVARITGPLVERIISRTLEPALAEAGWTR